jgi:putative transcriptional regulator
MENTLLSKTLKDARKAQRLTQMELSDLSGASASVIYKLESGRTDVSLESLLAVAGALGVQLRLRSPLGEEIVLNG